MKYWIFHFVLYIYKPQNSEGPSYWSKFYKCIIIIIIIIIIIKACQHHKFLFSRHLSLSAIALHKSSRWHPVFTHTWWIKIFWWLDNTGLFLYWSQLENVTYEVILIPLVVPCIYCLSFLDSFIFSFGEGWWKIKSFLRLCQRVLCNSKTGCYVLETHLLVSNQSCVISK